MLKLQIDYNITHFEPSYPKIFSGERGTVLTYRFEKLMFQVLSAYKNSMKKFKAIQKKFRIKIFFKVKGDIEVTSYERKPKS